MKSISRRIALLVMVGSSQQEHDAEMLVDSMRDFGGAYGKCPIFVVQTDTERLACRGLAARGAQLVPLKMNEKYRSYPFADKVFACAQIEKMVAGDIETLVWMNPECLVLQPPVELELTSLQAAAVRPVHIKNVGSSANELTNPYWSTVFKACGLDPDEILTVESFVDGQKIRAYFNSGTMSIRPDKGILQVWCSDFEKLLEDKAFQETIADDRLHRLFLHQVVFSAVLVSKLQPSEIKMLPPEYGYPLHLHAKLPVERRARAINDLVTIIYEDYFHQHDWDQGITVREPVKSWLKSRLTGKH